MLYLFDVDGDLKVGGVLHVEKHSANNVLYDQLAVSNTSRW